VARRPAAALEHAVEGLLHGVRGAVGQAGDDRAAGEDLGIGREHDRGHGAAGGQPGDEDAAAVDRMRGDHALDHRMDRRRLAEAALRVAAREPVEAGLRVVLALLLREEQREAMAIGEARPAGAVIVAGRRLRAAVQDDDERRSLRQRLRHVFEHAQIAGIGAEALDLAQPVRDFGRSGRPRGAERRLPGAPVTRELRDRASKFRQGEPPLFLALSIHNS
jgi:hypothetical protein